MCCSVFPLTLNSAERAVIVVPICYSLRGNCLLCYLRTSLSLSLFMQRLQLKAILLGWRDGQKKEEGNVFVSSAPPPSFSTSSPFSPESENKSASSPSSDCRKLFFSSSERAETAGAKLRFSKSLFPLFLWGRYPSVFSAVLLEGKEKQFSPPHRILFLPTVLSSLRPPSTSIITKRTHSLSS